MICLILQKFDIETSQKDNLINTIIWIMKDKEAPEVLVLSIRL